MIPNQKTSGFMIPTKNARIKNLTCMIQNHKRPHISLLSLFSFQGDTGNRLLSRAETVLFLPLCFSTYSTAYLSGRDCTFSSLVFFHIPLTCRVETVLFLPLCFSHIPLTFPGRDCTFSSLSPLPIESVNA